MYLYPSGALLGSRYTGLTGIIGYKLIGNTTQSFNTNNIIETTVPGAYEYNDGVNPVGIPLPDGFQGTIVWGNGTIDLAVEWVGPNQYENVDTKISDVVSGVDELEQAILTAITNVLNSFQTSVVASISQIHVDVVNERVILGPCNQPLHPIGRIFQVPNRR